MSQPDYYVVDACNTVTVQRKSIRTVNNVCQVQLFKVVNLSSLWIQLLLETQLTAGVTFPITDEKIASLHLT